MSNRLYGQSILALGVIAWLSCGCATYTETQLWKSRSACDAGHPEASLQCLSAIPANKLQSKYLWGRYTSATSATIKQSLAKDDVDTAIAAYRLLLDACCNRPSAHSGILVLSREAALAANSYGRLADALEFLRIGLRERTHVLAGTEKAYQFYLMGMQYEALGDLEVAAQYGSSAVKIIDGPEARSSYMKICIYTWYLNLVLNSDMYDSADAAQLGEYAKKNMILCRGLAQQAGADDDFYNTYLRRSMALYGITLCRARRSRGDQHELNALCRKLKEGQPDRYAIPLFFECGDFDAATKLIDATLSPLLSRAHTEILLVGLTPHHLSRLIKMRAQIAARKRDYRKVAQLLSMGLRCCNQTREHMRTPAARAALAAVIEDLCSTVVAYGSRLPDSGLLFTAMESSKSRLFLDILNNRQQRQPGDTDPRLEELLRLRRSVQHLALLSDSPDIFNAYRGMSVGTSSLPDANHKRTFSLVQAEYNHLLSALRRDGLMKMSGSSGSLCSLRQLQQALDDDTVLLSYYLDDRQLAILVISAKSVHAEYRPCKEGDIRKDVTDLVTMLSTDEGRPDSTAAALSDILLEPVRKHIADFDSIIISPHRALHSLPFCFLKLDGKRLASNHNLSFVMSCSALVSSTASELPGVRTSRRIAAFGNPSAAGWAKLPSSEEELRTSKTFFESMTLFLREACNRQNFMRAADGGSDLVISSHTVFDSDTPLLSRIVMADSAAGKEAYVTSDDITSLRIPGVNVFLNSCSSGKLRGIRGSDIPVGDEYFGLPQAFLVAKARSVTCTLWPLSDLHAARFGVEYHRRLSRVTGTYPASAVLAETQRALAAKGNIPLSAWTGYKVFVNNHR